MTQHITITTQPPTDTPPEKTRYQLLIEEVMLALDEIMAILPMVDEAEGSISQLVRNRMRIPDAFCATAIMVVEQFAELQAAKKLDVVVSRDKLQFLEAVRPLADRAAAVAKRLRFVLMAVKSSLVGDALQVLRIAKGFASDGRSPLMSSYVENMQRDLAIRVATRAEREKRKAARQHAAFEAMRKEVTAA